MVDSRVDKSFVPCCETPAAHGTVSDPTTLATAATGVYRVLCWLLPETNDRTVVVVGADAPVIADRLSRSLEGVAIQHALSLEDLQIPYGSILVCGGTEPKNAVDLPRELLDRHGIEMAIVLGRTATMSGFRQRLFGMSQNRDNGRSLLVELTDHGDVSVYRAQASLRSRYLPDFLLERTFPLQYTVMHRSPACELHLDIAKRLAATAVPGLEPALPARLQSKNKLILELRNPGSDHAFLKLPLSAYARRGLIRSDHVLGILRHNLPPGHRWLALLPASKELATGDGLKGWLETACVGQPLSTIGNPRAQVRHLVAAARLVGEMAELPGACLPCAPTGTPRTVMVAHLTGIIRTIAPELLSGLQTLNSRLEEGGAAKYLRKGDFSLSNLLVTDGGLSGIIDWDESGVTTWPLANLADLVLSWLWQKQHLCRADSLPRLLAGDPIELVDGLTVDDLVESAGGSRTAWRGGILQSFFDHAYYGLLEQTGPRLESRASSILIDPLRRIEDVLVHSRS